MADLKKIWGKYVPQAKILARWAMLEDLKKFNFKKLPGKVASIWGLEGKPLKNWPHEAQFLLVALIKLASNEADLIRAAKKLSPSVDGADVRANKSFLGGSLKAASQDKIKKFLEGKISFSDIFKKSGKAELISVVNKYVYDGDEDWREGGKYFNEALGLWGFKTPSPFVGLKISADKVSVEDLDGSMESLLLDYAANCCQGFGGAGESCVYAGHTNPDQGYFGFREKGKLFAQGWYWYDKERSVVIIDSLEFKGNWRNSLGEAFKALLKELKARGVKSVVVGRSPNRHDFNDFAASLARKNQRGKKGKRAAQKAAKAVNEWLFKTSQNDWYTDITRGYYTIVL